MPDIVIAGGARTPVGKFLGGLSGVPVTKLGEIAVKEAMVRAKTDPSEVEQVIMGIVLQGNAGGGPARQVCINAGIPAETSSAYAINQLCASGMRAIAEGYKSIKLGENSVVVAGGMESMSGSPHIIPLRNGVKMGDAKLMDTMLRDGLIDAFHGYHMGNTAENVAKKWQLTREEQDKFAFNSQSRAEAAIKSGRFKDEIVPVTIPGRKGDIVIENDEHPTFGTTMDTLAKLRPAFDKEGTVTAGNASGINDGGAAVVLMTEETAKKKGVEPLGRIVSWASTGVDPSIMGVGPILSVQKALALAGWTKDDIEYAELNEAFAAQSLAVLKDLGWENSLDKINLNGGAIALGHPIGCSGARITISLLYEMQKQGVKKGIAAACVGGGMGIAMCVERY